MAPTFGVGAIEESPVGIGDYGQTGPGPRSPLVLLVNVQLVVLTLTLSIFWVGMKRAEKVVKREESEEKSDLHIGCHAESALSVGALTAKVKDDPSLLLRSPK